MVFSTSLPPFVAAGVHVDGDERLGFVDDDVAAAREPDLAVKGVVDLLLHAEALEDGLRAAVVLDAAGGAPGNLADEVDHPLHGVLVVADDLVDFVGEEIADGALDEVGLLEDAGGRGLALHRVLDRAPLLDEKAEVADEVARALPFADGADDDAHAFRDVEFLEDLAQAVALLRALDLARDAALVAVGHQHEIASGEAEIRGDARALWC